MRPAEAHGASTAAPPPPASFGPAKGDSILTDRTLSTLRTTTTTKKSPFRAPRFSRGNNLRTEKLPSSASQKNGQNHRFATNAVSAPASRLRSS